MGTADLGVLGVRGTGVLAAVSGDPPLRRDNLPLGLLSAVVGLLSLMLAPNQCNPSLSSRLERFLKRSAVLRFTLAQGSYHGKLNLSSPVSLQLPHVQPSEACVPGWSLCAERPSLRPLSFQGEDL